MRLADRIALAIALTAIAAAFLAAAVPKETLARTPLCWSQAWLGRECAGCGLTRSFAAIGRGRLAEANWFNPMGPLLFAWAVAVVAVRAGRTACPRFRYWSEIDLAFALAVAIALIVRLASFYLA